MIKVIGIKKAKEISLALNDELRPTKNVTIVVGPLIDIVKGENKEKNRQIASRKMYKDMTNGTIIFINEEPQRVLTFTSMVLGLTTFEKPYRDTIGLIKHFKNKSEDVNIKKADVSIFGNTRFLVNSSNIKHSKVGEVSCIYENMYNIVNVESETSFVETLPTNVKDKIPAVGIFFNSGATNTDVYHICADVEKININTIKTLLECCTK